MKQKWMHIFCTMAMSWDSRQQLLVTLSFSDIFSHLASTHIKLYSESDGNTVVTIPTHWLYTRKHVVMQSSGFRNLESETSWQSLEELSVRRRPSSQMISHSWVQQHGIEPRHRQSSGTVLRQCHHENFFKVIKTPQNTVYFNLNV